MIPRITIENTNTLRRVLPVLLPILLVTCMTAALRVGAEITARRTTDHSSSATEQVLVQYLQISELLRNKDNVAALTRLRRIDSLPVRLGDDSFQDGRVQSMDPQSAVLTLGIRLMAGAKERRDAGDISTARAYAHALRRIGYCLVSSSDTTAAEQILSAHFTRLAEKTDAAINQREAVITPRIGRW